MSMSMRVTQLLLSSFLILQHLGTKDAWECALSVMAVARQKGPDSPEVMQLMDQLKPYGVTLDTFVKLSANLVNTQAMLAQCEEQGTTSVLDTNAMPVSSLF